MGRAPGGASRAGALLSMAANLVDTSRAVNYIHGVGSTDYTARLDELARRREHLDVAQRELTAELREVIPAARDAGISVTEVARRLGMSREAVHRLYLRRPAE